MSAPSVTPGPRIWRAYVAGAAAGVALFTLLMATAMLIVYARSRLSDPLNDPAMLAMRAKFMENPDDAAMKTAIRKRDFEVRKDFFVAAWRLDSGAWMLGLASAVTVILMGVLVTSREPEPDPERYAMEEGTWTAQASSRRGVAAFAVTVLLLLILAALVWGKRTELKYGPDSGGTPPAAGR